MGDPQLVSGDCVFLWTEARGMRRLFEVLTNDYGLDLAGWTLIRATAISQDGNVIVGYGTNPSGQTEGWITELAPALEINRGLGHVVLSWNRNEAAGFVLQQTAAVIAASTWTNVSTPPAVINDRYVITNNTDADKSFYRLVKP